MITLYILHTHAVDPESPAVQALITPRRREKMARLMQPEDRLRSTAAELCLSLALAGEDVPRPVPWETCTDGKPYLPGGRNFSLSHSGDTVICAVSDAPVGADAEICRPLDPRLGRRILAEGEAAEDLLGTWVAKESYLKLTGEGLRRSMTEIRCTADQVIDGDTWAYLHRCTMGNAVMAVCSFEEAALQCVLLDARAKAL